MSVEWTLISRIFVISFSLLLFITEGFGFDVIVDTLPVGQPAKYVLNSTREYIIKVDNLTNSIERVPPRIFVKCENCEENHPLLIVVRQNKGVLSWEIPFVIESKNKFFLYKETKRTLCPYDIMNFTDTSVVTGDKSMEFQLDENITQPVTLALSTLSDINIEVDILVNLEKDFVIHFNNSRKTQVTPSSPSLYWFEFPPENITSVLLHVTSKDDTCLIVSVQNVSCPVFDLEQNVQYRGYFQTVTRQGGLTLNKEAFPNGFYIVLIVSDENDFCSSMFLTGKSERIKNVEISLSKTITEGEFKIAVGVTLFVITLFCLVIFAVQFYSFEKEKMMEDDFLIDNEGASTSASNPPCVTSPPPLTPEGDTLSIKTDSSLDETDFDQICDAELDKNIFRMKGYLYVYDLARKNEAVLKKKSELYFWNLLTVAIFYFLPVIQLVITNKYQVNQSGKIDLCYYNFLCAHPLWFFSDFNHVFSNIGYFFFGGLFMVLTVLKERVYRIKIYRNKKLYGSYGIPQHFGLFYAMGAALIIEGVLSSCYHICPNHYNFQFDSSFMYVISTLCMIKIYQTRHPDINASAYATFFLLAAAIFIGMCGVFSNTLTFWILFTVLHLSTCIYLSLKIYYIGRWRLGFSHFIRFLKELQTCRNCNWKFFLPMFPTRFILMVVANACNWGLAIGSFMYNIDSFSSYLLIIFMVNLMLYTTFYILMKFICRERLLLRVVIYILLATLCWASALYFFLNKTISWRLTPAESKLYNQPCRLMSFYDNHDIWHFLSAAAMFFSFMVLLTLDDDLVYVQRSKILVF